jgi:hypothetical protein
MTRAKAREKSGASAASATLRTAGRYANFMQFVGAMRTFVPTPHILALLA